MSTEWKIGTTHLNNRVIVAPLAGITDKVFRRILEEMGVGLCFTEMVSAKALIYQNKRPMPSWISVERKTFAAFSYLVPIRRNGVSRQNGRGSWPKSLISIWDARCQKL